MNEIKRADEGMGFLLKFENVAWYEDGVVRILDRRIYPIRTEFVICTDHKEVAAAIAGMVTQSGGPYLAATMGMALAAYEARELSGERLLKYLEDAAYTLSHARPTTAAAMTRLTGGALGSVRESIDRGCPGREIVEDLRAYALAYITNNYIRHDAVAEYLADLIPRDGTILTQCFAETIVGTLIRECHRRNSNIRMICAETRPFLQGARLTASVACDMGADVTVISDNMPGFVMKEEKVDVFTSAADIITMDGHIVNKVGTFQIALAASYHGIPYYVTGEPDRDHPGIDSVRIEYRDPEAVLGFMGEKVTMDGVKGLYPAFDITPPELCSGVVTHRGVYSPHALKDCYLI